MKSFGHRCVVCSIAVVVSCVGTRLTAGGRRTRPAPATLPGAWTEVYKTVGDVRLPIHIFTPDAHDTGAQRPAIVFFFGGGWRSGSPGQFQNHCAYLASRGMVAMTAEYRVSSRHGVKAVSCFRDAKSAVRWARLNAERLGIDPRRIAAGGGSAGGHLAGALGTIAEFDEEGEDTAISAVPNALVLFNPALVLAPVEGQEHPDMARLSDLAERMGVEPERLSPYHHVREGRPPTIVFHGKADTTVPYFTAQLFTEKMQAMGNRCELVGYEGQPHGFFNFGRSDNKYFLDTVAKMDTFLASLGYLEGPPTVGN
jgi:acetyl esterase/lipase